MRKTIFVTGASGFLGTKLIERLLDNSKYRVLALLLNQENEHEFRNRFPSAEQERLAVIKEKDLSESLLSTFDIDSAIHFAFSRRNCPYSDIASSIDFCGKIFRILSRSGVLRVIYISSQGVYGNTQEIRTEQTIPAPATVYSMAKYAGEKMLQVYFEGTDVETTIVRLEGIIQSQKLVRALCKQVADTNKICLKGGKQKFSYLDADDAVAAFEALLLFKGKWKPIYNIGPNRCRYNLVEVAEAVAQVGEKLGYGATDILLETQDIEMWAGMDSSLITQDTGWVPQYDLHQMIERIYKSME